MDDAVDSPAGRTPRVGVRLREVVERATPRLLACTEAQASHRPAPGKWSAKEVIGHLVDSASVNHERFVRALGQDDLVFAGYDQDAWVAAQRYGEAAWAPLVTLWSALNLHLAWVMDAMPAAERTRPRARHNLHELAFGAMDAGAAATLEAFLLDYVAHLEHHLRQAFAAVA